MPEQRYGKEGNADSKGNFGLMNYSYNVVDVNHKLVNQEILIMQKSEILLLNVCKRRSSVLGTLSKHDFTHDDDNRK